MYLDVKFFKNVIHMLETDHNIIRPLDNITEAWKFHVDQTITQCKDLIKAAEYQEERDSVFTDFDEVVTRLEEIGWYPILKTDTYIEFDDYIDEE